MDSGWVQAWTGMIGLTGLGWTVYYARNAWKEAQAANKQTRDQFVAERRAWCSFDVEGPKIWVENYVVKGEAAIGVTNVGQSPAQRVEFNRLGFFTQPEEKKLAEAIDQARISPAAFGETIFPRQALNFTSDWKWDGTANALGSRRTYLHGWISYWVAGDQKRHVTPFIVQYDCQVGDLCSVTKTMGTRYRLSLTSD